MLPYKETGGEIYQKLAQDRAFTRSGAHKPFGHSAFPYELAGGPKAWIGGMGMNMVFYRTHDFGGHFAALDAPDVLAKDLRDFFTQHWPR